MHSIEDSKILIIATDGYEKSELEQPLHELRSRGATVAVAAPHKTLEPGIVRAWNGHKADWDGGVPVDLTFGEIDPDDFDALVIPGGVMNPDKLRRDGTAVDLVRQFVAQGKVVAAICHGPWLLVEAGVLTGRTATSFASIKTDMVNAGADWVDEAVAVDDGIITSRSPADIPAFVDKIVEEVEEGRHTSTQGQMPFGEPLH
jgi:protease I